MARYVDIGRETKDLDFTIQRLSNEISALQKMFNDIVRVEIEDGFVFMNPSIVPLEHFQMEYPGAHVKIEVRFGKAKFPLFIDLGFGDLVHVREQELLLLSNSKGPLFEPSLTVNCYPMEFVFAEKLETTVFRGADNSRMKDFHDLYTIASSGKMLNEKDTKKQFVWYSSIAKRHYDCQSSSMFQRSKHCNNTGDVIIKTAATSAGCPAKLVEIIKIINKFIG